MGLFIDLTGKRFGKLEVIKRVKLKKNKTHWLCLCDCGNTTIVEASNLKTGNTKSCGCFYEHHGKRKTKLYGVWCAIRNRCYNKNVKEFKWYGARGITVCESWKNSFLEFNKWATSTGYREGLSIDRIDTNKNYEPENCRWTNQKEQQSNRRNNVLIEIDGVIHTQTEWARISGVSRQTIARRLKNGIKGKALIILGRVTSR